MAKNKKAANAKARGRGLQQKVAKDFAKMTGLSYGKDEMIASREMGQSGTDVRLIGDAKRLLDVAVECKACETWSPHGWIKQATANLEGMSDWIVICRRPGERKPVCLMSAGYFRKLVEGEYFYDTKTTKMWPVQKWVDAERKRTKDDRWSIAVKKPDGDTILIIEYSWYLRMLSKLVEERK